jgi:hypothetical protein
MIDGAYLVAENDTVFSDSSIAFLCWDVDGRRPANVNSIGEWKHNRHGGKTVANVVLNHDTRSAAPLLMSDNRIEIDFDDLTANRTADHLRASKLA